MTRLWDAAWPWVWRFGLMMLVIDLSDLSHFGAALAGVIIWKVVEESS